MTDKKKDIVTEYYENNIGIRKDFVNSIGFSPKEKVDLLRAYDGGLDNLKKMVSQSISQALQEYGERAKKTLLEISEMELEDLRDEIIYYANHLKEVNEEMLNKEGK
jgi:hypothetical protein